MKEVDRIAFGAGPAGKVARRQKHQIVENWAPRLQCLSLHFEGVQHLHWKKAMSSDRGLGGDVWEWTLIFQRKGSKVSRMNMRSRTSERMQISRPQTPRSVSSFFEMEPTLTALPDLYPTVLPLVSCSCNPTTLVTAFPQLPWIDRREVIRGIVTLTSAGGSIFAGALEIKKTPNVNQGSKHRVNLLILTFHISILHMRDK